MSSPSIVAVPPPWQGPTARIATNSLRLIPGVELGVRTVRERSGFVRAKWARTKITLISWNRSAASAEVSAMGSVLTPHPAARRMETMEPTERSGLVRKRIAFGVSVLG